MNNGTLNEDKDYLLARRSRLKWGSVVAHDGRQLTTADRHGEYTESSSSSLDQHGIRTHNPLRVEREQDRDKGV